MDLVSTLSGDRRVAREAALGVWRLRAARAAVLGLAAALRLWRIDQNGLGTDYYSAAVRSMMTGWHAFFYNSFDPAGFVSVDKPPLALWIQVASAWVLGFDGLAVLLPQVIEGVVAVWLVAHLVERRFGAGAGLLAGLFLAITPVSVAADRSSNTDSCLVLALLLAAWALARAAEDARRDLLLLSMALLGLAFNGSGRGHHASRRERDGAALARGDRRGAVAVGAATLGLAALSVTPGAWALSSVLAPPPVLMLPSADLARLSVDGGAPARRPRPADTRRLVEFLRANRNGERFLLATSSATVASPIIIRGGEAVMAMGGFHGLDPILTPEKLAAMVASREVR